MAPLSRLRSRNRTKTLERIATATSSPYFTAKRHRGRHTVVATVATAAAVVASASSSTAAFVTTMPSPRVGSSSASRAFSRIAAGRKSDDKKPSASRGKPKKRKVAANTERTSSFQPVWHGKLFPDSSNTSVPVHTLILGTHPSIKSLEEEQYFGHPLNAFWWIAGDCLGFRRASGISPSTGKPYQLTEFVRHDNVLSYEEQQHVLVKHGFALWDIVGSCRRPGSLDQDIFDEVPNPLRAFANQHPSVKRIVFANGGTGCKIFIQHFQEWLGSGELHALEGHELSQKTFAKVIVREEKKQQNNGHKQDHRKKIDLVVALGVSPAAARYSYEQKRDFWEEFVYQPGLADFEAWQQQQTEAK